MEVKMENQSNIIIETYKGLGWIKLDRKKALNALSFEMLQAIDDQLAEWKDDPSIHLVCITSTQDKAFCAGGDVKSVYLHAVKGDHDYPINYLAKEYIVDYHVQTYPKPILVYLNGIVMGGGVGLSIGANYRIVTENTKWAMPEVRIGFFPDVAASYFLNKFPGSIGRYLGLTAKTIDCLDLIYLGAADYYMKSQNWDSLEREIKSIEWSRSDTNKRLEQLLANYQEINLPKSEIAANEDHINAFFSFDQMEEIVEKLQEAKSKGDALAKDILSEFKNLPPTSLKTILELLIRGREMSLLDCFKMELDLSVNIVDTHNFKEGVRSVLVDKDKRFAWNPKELSEVTMEEVKEYFNTMWKNDVHPLDFLE
jgi:enoyl-CoA hydratase